MDIRVPSIHNSGARIRALQPVVLRVAYTRVSLLGNGTVALASKESRHRGQPGRRGALGRAAFGRHGVRGGVPALYFISVLFVGLPAAVALLALPWYVGLVTWGRSTRPPPPRPPLLPRSPSTEHRAGLSSVGGRVL
eukprot:COSAG01_NODE_35595_length_529_cov_6.820930_1_plen_137_part_00